jgi:hypothetical protein
MLYHLAIMFHRELITPFHVCVDSPMAMRPARPWSSIQNCSTKNCSNARVADFCLSTKPGFIRTSRLKTRKPLIVSGPLPHFGRLRHVQWRAHSPSPLCLAAAREHACAHSWISREGVAGPEAGRASALGLYPRQKDRRPRQRLDAWRIQCTRGSERLV